MTPPATEPTVPVMIIAGEPSGDTLASELVAALARSWPAGSRPRFFGAGGEKMADAGVELLFDLASHAVVGLIEVVKNYRRFKRTFDSLLSAALERRPSVVILVDFSGFNRRFAAALRARVSQLNDGWKPKIIYFVSPQVWASRPGRAKSLERDLDLLLAIFPFEKSWYSTHAPSLKVDFVGHPIASRYAEFTTRIASRPAVGSPVRAVLLPGSRVGELKRHLPVLIDAAFLISEKVPTRWTMVLPNERLHDLAASIVGDSGLEIISLCGGLAETLINSDLAIASTGTVTMECAFFQVPTVALYKTSWSTYQIGRRIVKVPYLAMPNILAGEAIFPEFVQDAATPRNIADAALELLHNASRRTEVTAKLGRLREQLGDSGACERAARSILALLGKPA